MVISIDPVLSLNFALSCGCVSFSRDSFELFFFLGKYYIQSEALFNHSATQPPPFLLPHVTLENTPSAKFCLLLKLAFKGT